MFNQYIPNDLRTMKGMRQTTNNKQSYPLWITVMNGQSLNQATWWMTFGLHLMTTYVMSYKVLHLFYASPLVVLCQIPIHISCSMVNGVSGALSSYNINQIESPTLKTQIQQSYVKTHTKYIMALLLTPHNLIKNDTKSPILKLTTLNLVK